MAFSQRTYDDRYVDRDNSLEKRRSELFYEWVDILLPGASSFSEVSTYSNRGDRLNQFVIGSKRSVDL